MEISQAKEKIFSKADMIRIVDEMDKQLVRMGKDLPNISKQKTKINKYMKISQEHQVDASQLQIKEYVNSGAFGSVFKGVYRRQEVAVKVLEWEEDISNEDDISIAREAFAQEVSICEILNHHNITKFIGAAIDLPIELFQNKGCKIDIPKNVACMIHEYLHGGDLKSYLKKHQKIKLSFKTVIQLALDLARGISYMHSKRIVHRDIKPENMLLHKNGTLKIIDFGIARVEDPTMRYRAGTRLYMAPEVLTNKPYNHKCDVYSFGICLWQIYHCDVPYNNFKDFAFKFIMRICKKSKRPQISNHCPASLANLIKRCWHQDPKKRPEMTEVVSILENLNTSESK